GLVFRGSVHVWDNGLIARIKKAYGRSLNVALRRHWMVLGIAVLVFAGSVWLFTRLRAEFVPKLDEGSITSMLYKPVGMSMEESLRTDIEVEDRLLKDFP